MKRFIVILLLSLEMFVFAFADTPYALFVENDHWIYDAMHILSVESRQTTLQTGNRFLRVSLPNIFLLLTMLLYLRRVNRCTV